VAYPLRLRQRVGSSSSLVVFSLRRTARARNEKVILGGGQPRTSAPVVEVPLEIRDEYKLPE